MAMLRRAQIAARLLAAAENDNDREEQSLSEHGRAVINHQ
jgi:hypothetical protein